MRIILLVLSFTFLFLSCKKEESTTETNLTVISSLTTFEDRVNSGVSLVFFHATWCSICAKQRPEVEGLVGDSELSHVFLGEVDFEKNSAIVQKYNVFGFPTILILKDGVVKHSLTGSSNKKAQLKELLKAL
ncbi:MAG: thioredoxin family protein [Saprospiraceae bacterium]